MLFNRTRWMLPAAIAVLALCCPGAVMAATAAEWAVLAVRGTALALVNDRWQEVNPGESVSGDAIVRTLQAGRLELKLGGNQIRLEPNTALKIAEAGNGSRIAITLYSGMTRITAARNSNERVTVETPALGLATSGASFSVTLNGANTELVVGSGAVAVTNKALGTTLAVKAGQKVNSSGELKSNENAARSTESGRQPDASGADRGKGQRTDQGQGNDKGQGSGNGEDHSGGKSENSNGNGAGKGN